MRGSVKKRGATWCYVLDLGRDPVTKKRHQLLKRGFRTEGAAEDALSLVLGERVETGGILRPAKGTVAEYLAAWLDSQTERVRPATLHSYRKLIEGRIVPKLGAVKLAELDTATIEAFYTGLRRSGGRNGGPLSAKTCACAAGVLHKALRDAVRLRKLRHNPASDAVLPKRERARTTAWTAEEAAAFLQAVEAERWSSMWHLVLATGMRRGELLGLRWSDVDLDAQTIDIVETRTVAGGELVGPPKTDKGTRTVSLDVGTVAALKAWRKRLAADKLAAGPAWTDSGRVFVDEIGRPPHPETVTGWWSAAVKRTGSRPIRLHDARHTAATLMLRAGVPVKVVSERIGHADVTVTLGIYQHVTKRDDQAAADVLGGLLRPSVITQ